VSWELNFASELTVSLDPAFRDRADIVQYIGLPPTEAIYDMLHSCLKELMTKGIVQHLVSRTSILSVAPILMCYQPIPNRLVSDPAHRAAMAGHREWDASSLLWTLSANCKVSTFSSCISIFLDRSLQGLSGRALRRLPVLAHARALSYGVSYSASNLNGKLSNGLVHAYKKRGISVERWITDMNAVVAESRAQLELLE
jgi:pachytene checkpoint protein 2